jgi:predicted TIM-barrel fold metal-dependent hydrolase
MDGLRLIERKTSMTQGKRHFISVSENNPTVNAAMSRREFLKTLAVAGAGAGIALTGGQLLAQNMPTPRGRIDVHHHMAPDFYVQFSEKQSKGKSAMHGWTPAVSLDVMDNANVETAMLSPAQGVVRDSMSDKSEQARTLARQNNEAGAKAVTDNPKRFGLFAALPLPDTDGSLKEIEYSLGPLKADGIALFTSYLDKFPGDPAFAPVFDELNKRKAVVFFHPAHSLCCRTLTSQSGMIDFDLDTARAIDSLLFEGTFSRCPDIKFIFSHAGGAFTTLAPRMVDDFPKKLADRVPHGVDYEFKKLYFDTAHAGAAGPMDALKDLVPVSQILYGSDVPIRAYSLTDDKLKEYQGFSAADWRAIDRGNAEKLFPRLKA